MTIIEQADAPDPLRGEIDLTQCMETLQEGYLHAVCAAARCSLAKPNRDRGIDWKVSHQSEQHTHDFEANLRVQLKSTYQVNPNSIHESFPITIENKQLARLAHTPVTVSTILVAMLLPREIDEWLSITPESLLVRHCCYWVNLEGHPITGQEKTTVRVPTSQVFDDAALCAMMERIGKGGKA